MFTLKKRDKNYVDIRIVFNEQKHKHDYGEASSKWSTYTIEAVKRGKVYDLLPQAELIKLSHDMMTNPHFRETMLSLMAATVVSGDSYPVT